MKQNLIRLAGVTAIIAVLLVLLGLTNENALQASNLIDVFNRHGFMGIITIGVALLIITGGIDLSIGSVVGLGAVLFGVLMEIRGLTPWLAFAVTLACGPLIGTAHAFFVTNFKLQPFLVTLCGMFIYRGIARGQTASNVGLIRVQTEHPDFKPAIESMRSIFIGKDENGALNQPMMLFVMLGIALVMGLILHLTAYGRYWYAIGSNEKAAEYAGVRVSIQKWLVYMICSTLAIFAGILFLLDQGSAAPDSVGQSLELYAITAAVLGGCSLRGGEGLMLGFVLGALVQPLINNYMVFAGFKASSEPWIMGSILLWGTITDEVIRNSKAIWETAKAYLRILRVIS